jgi:hypothetical protein
MATTPVPAAFLQQTVTLDGRKKTMSWAEALTAGNNAKRHRDRLRDSTWFARTGV